MKKTYMIQFFLTRIQKKRGINMDFPLRVKTRPYLRDIHSGNDRPISWHFLPNLNNYFSPMKEMMNKRITNNMAILLLQFSDI